MSRDDRTIPADLKGIVVPLPFSHFGIGPDVLCGSSVLSYDLQYLGSISLARELLSCLANAAFTPAQQEAVPVHLANPSTPAMVLTQLTGASLDEIRPVYRWMQDVGAIAAVTTSPFYSRRLMYQFASETVSEWLTDPDRPNRILGGRPVA